MQSLRVCVGNIHRSLAMDGFSCRTLDREENFDLVARTFSMDYRAKLFEEPGYASVLEGLDFDPDRVRSQATAVIDTDSTLVAIVTSIIAPRQWVEQQKYIKKDIAANELRVVDFKTVNSVDAYPDYLFINGWTKVIPQLRGWFTFTGISYLRRVMSLVKDFAPGNKCTWMEWVANGTVKTSTIGDPLLMQVGQTIPAYSLSPELVGVCHPEARATEVVAQLLGQQRIENVGNFGGPFSLGSVFTSRLE